MNENYTVMKAKYAKNKFLIQVPSCDGFKTEISYLLDGLNCSYTNREHGYIASSMQLEKLKLLIKENFVFSVFTKRFYHKNCLLNDGLLQFEITNTRKIEKLETILKTFKGI